MAKALTTTTNHIPPVFGGKMPGNMLELRNIIDEAKKAWLGKTQSEKTKIAYSNDLDQFLEFHGINPTHIEHMTRILPEQVTSWRDHLKREGGRVDAEGNPQPAANSTIARKMTALRSFFSFLQNYGYRGANPAHPDFVAAPKVSDKGTTPAIEGKRMRMLLEAPNEELPTGIRDRALLAVFAYMALRVDELHQIKVGNIVRDGEHTIIKIKGKGNEDRRGVLPPLAAGPVNAWIEAVGIGKDRGGPLFRPGNSSRGNGVDGFQRKPMTIRSIQKRVKKYCEEVGIDEAISVHSLRVTAATEAHRAKVPLVDIQHWLGHKDPRTTLRYIRGVEDVDNSPAYILRYG